MPLVKRQKKSMPVVYDFIVLGVDGMQGHIVARDLLEKGYRVLLTDIVKVKTKDLLRRFRKQSAFVQVDLRDKSRTIGVIQQSGADVVINCAEGDWNLNVYQACLHTRRHVIDLGSRSDMTKDQLRLNKDFQAIGRTAITGCGAVPGIGNVMLAHAAKKLDSIESIEVGFAWDSNIKKFVVPFSIESIMEEYILPAPYYQSGRLRTIKPEKSVQNRNFRSIGSQKIFMADHSETFTFHHYFKSWGVKNIRFYAGFPKHSEAVIKTLINLTFADKRPIGFLNVKILADKFLVQLLKRLRPPRNYKELENLWVQIDGSSQRRRQRILMECLVPPLKGWEEAGCNIDTGFPAAIMAEMIKYGDISKPGSFAPEAVVPEKQFFKELRKKKLRVYENNKVIN
ncbi:MAG: saccharopine dehydrogenase C-terminal domain-containing protein [Patescibacteria group bacterium]